MSAGLPAADLRVVVEYMTAAEELRAAALALLADADQAPQVRLGDDGRAANDDRAVELRPVVRRDALERLRKAAGG